MIHINYIDQGPLHNRMRKRDPLRSRPPPNPHPKQRKISNKVTVSWIQHSPRNPLSSHSSSHITFIKIVQPQTVQSSYIATQDAMMETLLGLMKKQKAHQSENGNNELIYCTIAIRLFITIYFKNCYSD